MALERASAASRRHRVDAKYSTNPGMSKIGFGSSRTALGIVFATTIDPFGPQVSLGDPGAGSKRSPVRFTSASARRR